MTWTLLEIVQEVASETGFDEVNSIADTVDAQQITSIVRAVYEEVRELSDLPKSLTHFQLDATSTSTPTLMTIPEDVHEILELEYNVKEASSDPDNFRPLEFVDIVTFYRRTNARNEDDTEVDKITVAGVTSYKIMNDRAPSYFTVYNDKSVLFDAYDSALETNLQKIKTRCVGYTAPEWTSDDAFEIPLSPQLSRLLIEKAKARVNSSLRGVESREIVRAARRLEIRASSTKDRTGKKQIKVPNYARVR